MAYTITTEPFGPLTGTEPIAKYLLHNTETGEFVSILPDFGGIVRQLVLRAADTLVMVIDTPDSPQALLADETYASALLFPFPSRIRHGIYTFAGHDYTLPMNEVSRDNAIHGLVHRQPFAVSQQEVTAHGALLGLQYVYEGTVPGYPFPFTLEITYQLTDEGFTLAYTATNTGPTSCPVAFGWHPYFTLNNEPIDQLTITLPTDTTVTLDKDLLPTGRVPYKAAATMTLQDQRLDNVFIASPGPDGMTTTTLASERQRVKLTLHQDSSFGYVVVYTPARRERIAIEPLTANVNAFNTGEGLLVLHAGERVGGRIWVKLAATTQR